MPKFTKATARAAAAKRHRKAPVVDEGDIAAPPAPEDAPLPASFHGGLPPVEQAAVVVTAPPDDAPTIETPSDTGSDGSSAPAASPASTATIEITAQPFTPEIVEQFAGIAFDLVGAVTGRPQIWKLDPDEIKPIAPAIGHQLGRIPIIRAIGPDNTEMMIVAAGLGIIVTKRLNEHADQTQRERETEQQRLAGGGDRRSDIAPARSAPAAAPAGATSKGFASEGGEGRLHIGQRLS